MRTVGFYLIVIVLVQFAGQIALQVWKMIILLQ